MTIKTPVRTVEQLTNGLLKIRMGRYCIVYLDLRKKAETLRFKSLFSQQLPVNLHTDGYRIYWEQGELDYWELMSLILDHEEESDDGQEHQEIVDRR